MIGRRITELGPRVNEVSTIRRLGYDHDTDVRAFVDDVTGYVMLVRHGIIFEVYAGLTDEAATKIWAEWVAKIGRPIAYNSLSREECETMLSEAAGRHRFKDMWNAMQGVFSVAQDGYTEVRKDIRPSILRGVLESFMGVCRDINEDIRDATRRTRTIDWSQRA